MSVNIKDTTKGSLVENEKWCRLASCIVIHVKKALLGILHNSINHQDIKPLPSDPSDLYNEMINRKGKLKHLKQDDLLLLLPNDKKVFSNKLNIILLKYLIRTFCGILNEDRNWNKPRDEDHSIAAAVFRAASIRNQVLHHNDPESIQDEEFKTKWKMIEEILVDLQYVEDISYMKNGAFDPDGVNNSHSNMNKDFEDILDRYKEECKNDTYRNELRYFTQRNFKDESTNQIVTNIDALLRNHESIMVSADAGLGKTFSAKNMRYLWATDEILLQKKLLYIDCKKVNKSILKPSNIAPIWISEVKDLLKEKSDKYIGSLECVQKTITDLIIVIDGVNELNIEENNIDNDFLKELQEKIDKNDDISMEETIIGIYFGLFFPESKIITLGWKNEIQRLKGKQDELQQYKKYTRAVLELQPLDEDGVKEIVSLVTCNEASCSCTKCTDTYSLVKDVEFRNVPFHLIILIRILERFPNPNLNLDRFTKTKNYIITILNLLKDHTPAGYLKDAELLASIRNLAEISLLSLLDGRANILVKEYKKNGVCYFKYEQTFRGQNYCIVINRDAFEHLDFFYVRNEGYQVILEPRHITNMEFLSACHLFSHPDEWNSMLKLNKDRLLEIITFIAGLRAGDYSTNDFVANVLEPPLYSLEKFLSWLYDVEDVRESLPNGGYGYDCWFGLMENQKLSPSFFLLESISHEVEIPQSFVPQTIVCHSNEDYSFEWYTMDHFKDNFLKKSSEKSNLNSFLDKFPGYDLVIKGNMKINDDTEWNLLNEYNKRSNQVKFRIDKLHIETELTTAFDSSLDLNTLRIGEKCDSFTTDMILNLLSLPNTTTSTRPHQPVIQCKQLTIDNVTQFNSEQTERLFKINSEDTVDYITLGSTSSKDTFLTEQQIDILNYVEHNNINKEVNIQLYCVTFNRIIDLPELSSRHVSLWGVDNVNDTQLTEFRRHILPQPISNNLPNYRIVHPDVPFIRRRKHTRVCEKSMFLNFYEVDFTNVSPEVFADTFTQIPSVSFEDDDLHLPSSHWFRLSQQEESKINEIRIWFPQSKNFNHFINIKTKIIQFICERKDRLKLLLNHIVNNPYVQMDKEIRVFVVQVDHEDWDHYEEITLFSETTIQEYKGNYSSDNSRLDNINVPFHEGERHLKWWCCEISLPFQERTDFVDIFDGNENALDGNESAVDGNEGAVDGNESAVDGNESIVEVKDDESIPFFTFGITDNEGSGSDDQVDGDCCLLSKCCCCFW